MTNLYADLDVPPDASPEVIKRAYRRKAKAHHPDNGGDPQAFSRVAGAWMVLRDPERRARYDRGEPDAAIDDTLTMVGNMLCQLFGQLLLTGDPDHDDLIAKVRTSLKEMRRKSEATSKDVAKQVAKLEKARKRLSLKTDRPDLIGGMIAQQLSHMGENERNLTRERETIDTALLYCDDYVYAFDKRDTWGPPSGRNSITDYLNRMPGL